MSTFHLDEPYYPSGFKVSSRHVGLHTLDNRLIDDAIHYLSEIAKFDDLRSLHSLYMEFYPFVDMETEWLNLYDYLTERERYYSQPFTTFDPELDTLPNED